MTFDVKLLDRDIACGVFGKGGVRRTVSREDRIVRVTVDAERGELLYLAVTASDGSATGAYTVEVAQPIEGRVKSATAG